MLYDFENAKILKDREEAFKKLQKFLKDHSVKHPLVVYPDEITIDLSMEEMFNALNYIEDLIKEKENLKRKNDEFRQFFLMLRNFLPNVASKNDNLI